MTTTPVFGVPDEVVATFSESTRTCIERLRKYAPETTEILPHPSSKLAAVLILLYERAGKIHVLLTTRSKELRSHPGQMALPGGKVDKEDGDAIETAFREANEEVALQLHARPVRLPAQDGLRAAPGEVAHIFDHPLEALLDPELAWGEKLVLVGTEDWP